MFNIKHMKKAKGHVGRYENNDEDNSPNILSDKSQAFSFSSQNYICKN